MSSVDMQMGETEFEIMIKKQIENERGIATDLRDSIKKTSNAVIRLLFYQLALDSTKHENMLRTILYFSEPSSMDISNAETEDFLRSVERHVKSERKMLEDTEKIVDKTKDTRVRFILQNIISDEKRHHAIMERIYRLLCENERVEGKWWDFLFRYSLLRG